VRIQLDQLEAHTGQAAHLLLRTLFGVGLQELPGGTYASMTAVCVNFAPLRLIPQTRLHDLKASVATDHRKYTPGDPTSEASRALVSFKGF
jgi:hypothetical protein